ncbi:hypothetical protein [Endozoicomonas sp. YOMI1]|nr:hypothetical protein [Endozoicomonas sp. YOMI1]
MQSIKNKLFGPDALGIEYYPPEQQLTDKANIDPHLQSVLALAFFS